MSKDVVDNIIEMRKQGKGYMEIVQALGVSRDVVRYHSKKNGLGGVRGECGGYRYCNLDKRVAKANYERELLRRKREEVRRLKQLQLEQETLERLMSLKDRECEECGELFDATVISQVYCSSKCKDRRNDRVGKLRRDKRLRENGVIDWDISLEKLADRDNNICHICNKECDDDDYIITEEEHHIAGNNYPSIDHVIPISKGGTHTWDNVKVAHRYCNSVKHNSEIYEEGTGQLKMTI